MKRQRNTLDKGVLTVSEYGELLAAWLDTRDFGECVEFLVCAEVDTFPENHGSIGPSYHALWRSNTTTL